MYRLYIKIKIKVKHLFIKIGYNKKNSESHESSNPIIYYRISDAGYKKDKPEYINNENCLKNAVKCFPLNICEWHVIADNVCDETYEMIKKYIPESRINKVSVGHGAGTFRMAYEDALNHSDNQWIYFLENDYIHLPKALDVLIEGQSIPEADYITLYDHPDKYGYDTSNPFVIGGERTKVFLTKSTHWKITDSTTMTFASSVKTLKKDKKIFWRWTATRHPYDFQIFLNLKSTHNRNLICPIPGYSTHGETAFLSPLINWAKQI